MKIDVKEDRKEIERIIRINLPLMNLNESMCQEIADAIIVYFIEKMEEEEQINSPLPNEPKPL